MKYTVEYRVYMTTEVDAESFDEALEKADAKWYHAMMEKDSGFHIYSGEAYFAEDEDGNEHFWY